MAKKKHSRSTDWGAVRKLPSGRWQAREPIAGGYRPAPSPFESKTDALDWLKKRYTEVVGGRLGSNGLKPTDKFQVAYEEWFEPREKKYKKGLLSMKTYKDYRSTFRLHVLPFFGELELDSVDAHTVSKFQKWLDDRIGGKERTIQKAEQFAGFIFDYAVDQKAITANPFKNNRVVLSNHKSHRDYLDLEKEDIDLFSGAVRNPWGAAIITAAYTGLRAGELWGLRIKDVNFLQNVITVQLDGNVIECPDDPNHPQRIAHRLYRKTPKGKKARQVIMVKTVSRVLTEYITEWRSTAKPSDPLFVYVYASGVIKNPDLPVRHSAFYDNVFVPMLKALEREDDRDVFHSFRHYATTWFLTRNVPFYSVQSMMGHSSGEMTERYGHFQPNAMRHFALSADPESYDTSAEWHANGTPVAQIPLLELVQN